MSRTRGRVRDSLTGSLEEVTRRDGHYTVQLLSKWPPFSCSLLTYNKSFYCFQTSPMYLLSAIFWIPCLGRNLRRGGLPISYNPRNHASHDAEPLGRGAKGHAQVQSHRFILKKQDQSGHRAGGRCILMVGNQCPQKL